MPECSAQCVDPEVWLYLRDISDGRSESRERSGLIILPPTEILNCPQFPQWRRFSAACPDVSGGSTDI